MSDSSQETGRSYSYDELAFGAQIMCEALYRREIAEDQQARFVGLYGMPGRLLLASSEHGGSEALLLAAQLLVTIVPELREHFLRQSVLVFAESLRISATTGGTLWRIADNMGDRPPLFARLKAHRRARSAVTAANLRSTSGYKGPLTKKFLGRNDSRPNERTPGLNTTTTHDKPNKD